MESLTFKKGEYAGKTIREVFDIDPLYILDVVQKFGDRLPEGEFAEQLKRYAGMVFVDESFVRWEDDGRAEKEGFELFSLSEGVNDPSLIRTGYNRFAVFVKLAA